MHVRLNLDVSKSYITGREGILKLVNLQSFRCKNVVKMRKNIALRSLQILYIFVLRAKKITILRLKCNNVHSFTAMRNQTMPFFTNFTSKFLAVAIDVVSLALLKI